MLETQNQQARKHKKARVAFPTWHEDLVARKSPLSKAVQAIGPPSDPRMHRGRCDKKRQKMLYFRDARPQTIWKRDRGGALGSVQDDTSHLMSHAPSYRMKPAGPAHKDHHTTKF